MPAQKKYFSYLLRMWKDGDRRGTEWYVSLEDPHTGEKVNFPGLQACFKYLERLGSATHSPPEPPDFQKGTSHPET